jgi:hypothetical protein
MCRSHHPEPRGWRPFGAVPAASPGEFTPTAMLHSETKSNGMWEQGRELSARIGFDRAPGRRTPNPRANVRYRPIADIAPLGFVEVGDLG